LSPALREEVKDGLKAVPGTRLTKVLGALGVVQSRWYVLPVAEEQRRKRGPKPKEVPPHIYAWVKGMATANPWYGFKRIAVMCRRAGQPVKNRQAEAVKRRHGLLQKRKPRKA
jgi:hypothetical protein